MVVVMAPEATDEEIAHVVERVEERRRRGVRLQGRGPHDHRPGRRHRLLPPPQPAHPARRRGRAPDLRPLQAGQPAAPPRALDGLGRPGGQPGADRPGHLHVHRRPVRRRDRRADARGRADGAGGRRHAAARRGLQAAHLAVRLPGPRRRRAWRSWPTSARPTGLPVVTEVVDARDVAGRRRARRHAAGRHPQHGQLRAAAGGRRVRQAGAAQARHDRHHRGVADGGGVHRPARQPRRGPLRARHPHLRAGHPQHPRHLGGPGRAGDQPPADHRRPVARGRPQGPRRPAVPGGDRGRRRRRHRRRAPRPGVRRCATARRRCSAPTCASSPRPSASLPQAVGRVPAASLVGRG